MPKARLKMPRGFWTAARHQFLHDHYTSHGPKWIAEQLGVTIGVVVSYARRNGISVRIGSEERLQRLPRRLKEPRPYQGCGPKLPRERAILVCSFDNLPGRYLRTERDVDTMS